MDGPFFNPRAPLAIHTRHLPHWQQPGVLVFLTWRLADALPGALLESWQAERAAWLVRHPPTWDAATELAFRRRFPTRLERWLDEGRGSCPLRDPACSAEVQLALRHFDGRHFNLDSFVIMPNHIHLIVRLLADHPLPDIVKSWKSFSARGLNRQRNAAGSRWQEGYWERLVRDAGHLFRCRDYIRRNPEKARLASETCRLHISDAVY